MNLILILYLIGFIGSVLFFLFKGREGCMRFGLSQIFFMSVFWFIIIPVGLVWAYFYNKKQKKERKKGNPDKYIGEEPYQTSKQLKKRNSVAL